MSSIDPREKLYLQQAMKKMTEVFGEDEVCEIKIKIEELEVKRSCLTCDHYTKAGNLSKCELYGKKPPQYVIEKGCVGWEFDHWPF